MKRTSALLLAIASAILLSGCQTSLAGAPSRDLPDGYNANIFSLDPSRAILQQDWTKYTTPEEKMAARNEFVTARMYLIDRAYFDFETNILREAREGGFLTDLVTLGLTTAATAVGDKGLKTALSAGATGILGAKQAFDKEVLLDRAVQILQNQMRASRAATKTRILQRLRLPYDQWTIGLAQSDVEEYYQAGTLVGALTSAADAATTQKLEEEENANRVLSVAFQTGSATEALRTYLNTPAERGERDRRAALARVQLGAMGLPNEIPFDFVEFGTDEALKKQLLEKLRDAETDPAAKATLSTLLNGL